MFCNIIPTTTLTSFFGNCLEEEEKTLLRSGCNYARQSRLPAAWEDVRQRNQMTSPHSASKAPSATAFLLSETMAPSFPRPQIWSGWASTNKTAAGFPHHTRTLVFSLHRCHVILIFPWSQLNLNLKCFRFEQVGTIAYLSSNSKWSSTAAHTGYFFKITSLCQSN